MHKNIGHFLLFVYRRCFGSLIHHEHHFFFLKKNYLNDVSEKQAHTKRCFDEKKIASDTQWSEVLCCFMRLLYRGEEDE